MTETIESERGTCQPSTRSETDHANGRPASSVADATAAPTELRPTTSAAPSGSPDPCIDAIGCAVTGAAAGRSVYLWTPDGRKLHAGFSVIIAVEDPTHAVVALNHITASLKYAQAKKHVG